MNDFFGFSGYAKIYSVFWLFYSIWSARKAIISEEQRLKEIQEIIDGVIGLMRMLPVSVMRGLYASIWLVLTAIDGLGLALLFHFTGGDRWAKLLIVRALLGIVHGVRMLFDNLRSMDDEDALRASLLDGLGKWMVRWSNLSLIARVLAAVILAVVVHL